MAKSKKLEISSADKAEELNQQRIGIMMHKFMQAIPVGPQSHEKHIKCWQAGQIIWKEDDIELLLKLNAPIEIYYKWL